MDKGKEAYWEGYNAYKRWKEQHPNPLSELISPSYNPPSHYPEAYKAGWESAKRGK